MQILLVEDDLDVLEYLRLYLIERGHEVMSALTADEALRWLDCSSPELALVDLRLAKGHGRQVIYEISKRKLGTRMVVITASDDLELRREMQTYGVSAYLFKPITIRDLDEVVGFEPAQAPLKLEPPDLPQE